MDDRTLKFKVRDKVYEFDFGDVDGIESRDFRQATGLSFVQAVNSLAEGGIDLEPVGGIIWLIERRTNPKLKYEDVLKDLKFSDLIPADDDEEPDNPPA